MIFMHIIDDFFLQSAGFLCRCKQKDWWEQNENNPKYKNDYKIGLYLHAFEWTFMMMLPIAIYYQFNLDWIFLFIFIFNVFIHAWTDDLKANKKKLNLWEDQYVHFVQILYTGIILLWLVEKLHWR